VSLISMISSPHLEGGGGGGGGGGRDDGDVVMVVVRVEAVVVGLWVMDGGGRGSQ